MERFPVYFHCKKYSDQAADSAMILALGIAGLAGAAWNMHAIPLTHFGIVISASIIAFCIGLILLWHIKKLWQRSMEKMLLKGSAPKIWFGFSVTFALFLLALIACLLMAPILGGLLASLAYGVLIGVFYFLGHSVAWGVASWN